MERLGLFALVEVQEDTAVLLLVGDSFHVGAQGRILRAEGRTVIGPVVNSIGYSKFTYSQLKGYTAALGVEFQEDIDLLELQELAIRATIAQPRDTTPAVELEAKLRRLPDPDENGQVKIRPPKATDGAPTRPQSKTGATTAVWDICDRLYAEHSSRPIKEFRKLVMESCAFEEIHPGTASVQYSKWKQSKNL